MAKPADTSVQAFLRENPEYNISRLMEQSEKMENVPLREGAPSSLAAVRGQVPRRVRMDQAMKISQDAYRKWARRRSGALSYGSQPSVSEHLGDVQSQYGQEGHEADLQRRTDAVTEASKADVRRFGAWRDQDTGLSEFEGSEDTGDPGDTGDWEDYSGDPPDWLTDLSSPEVEVYRQSERNMNFYNLERLKYGLDPVRFRFDEDADQAFIIPEDEEPTSWWDEETKTSVPYDREKHGDPEPGWNAGPSKRPIPTHQDF